jgi:hypothetical protein
LLIIAVFDREVNCRRAGAAAFQEIVGRQGDLPNGIEIISVVDYHSVGNKKTAFTELAPFLSKFESYQEPLVQHLLSRKMGHWDKEIRCLAAESLYRINLIIPLEFINDQIIPQLISKSTENDLNARHGSILALGSVVRSLEVLGHQVPETLVKHIRSLVMDERFKKHLVGVGSELHVEALCCLIRECAAAKLHIQQDTELISKWSSLLIDACFGMRQNKNTVKSAIECTPVFVREYLANNQNSIKMSDWFDNIVKRFSSQDETCRATAFQVLGIFPADVLSMDLETTLFNLLVNYISLQKDMQMSNARAAAVSCLNNLIKIMPDQTLSVVTDIVIKEKALRQCFLVCTKDYTTGSRGDIAFKVRWNALQALEEVMLNLLHRQESQCQQMIEGDHKLITEILQHVVVHCVTNQEQMRHHASGVFWTLVKS